MPVTLEWADGVSSSVVLTGFELESPPAALQASLQTSGRAGSPSATAPGQILTPRIRVDTRHEPFLVPPLLVDSIEFSPSEVRSFGSNLSARWFSLGPPEQRIPPPPDWFSTWDTSPLWKPARLAPVDPTWTYLPGAAWLWTSSDWKPAVGEKVLFRQRFALPTDRAVLSAMLTVEADSTLAESYLNRLPLPWTSRVLGGKTVSASVERLLKPGENLIALSVVAPMTRQIDAAAVAWRLHVILGPAVSSRPAAGARAPFVVRLVDGGRIMAERVELSDSALSIERVSGETLRMSRAAVRWIEHWPRPLLDIAQTGLVPSASPAVDSVYDDIAEGEGVWLLNGTFYRQHISEWNPDPDRFTGPAGDGEFGAAAAGQAIRAVLASPAAGEWRWDIPTPDLARLAHVLLRDGSELFGLLEPSAADRLTLDVPGESKVVVPSGEVVWVEFPALASLRSRAAFEQIARGRSDPAIGLLGELSCQGGPGCPESVLPGVRRVAQALGVSTQWIKPQDLLSPEIFNPGRFPVLINLDQSEAYYHTIQRPGDGHQALLQYMNQGGILIHLAPGAPFFYGRQAHSRQWALVPLGGGLNRAFGLGIAVPGDSGAGRLFEVPDNSSTALEFTRVTATASWGEGDSGREARAGTRATPGHGGDEEADTRADEGIRAVRGQWVEALPRRVVFPGMADSRFRPISPKPTREGATLIPLYRLSRGKTDYGLAAAIVRLPSLPPAGQAGYAAYVAWPLALATDEFGDSLVPRLVPAILDAIAADRASAR